MTASNTSIATLTPSYQPAAILERAMASGASIEQLQQLLALQQQWEANEARKAFVVSLAAFKARGLRVKKNKTVKYNQTGYTHATLDNVVDTITPALAEEGLSLRWTVNQEGAQIRVTCILQHVMGHAETVTLGAQADTSGSKNSIQAIGSTVSYLERYTALAITGTATTDQDDDGGTAEPPDLITAEQAANLTALLGEVKADKAAMLRWLSVESIDLIPAARFTEVCAMLERKRQQSNTTAERV